MALHDPDTQRVVPEGTASPVHWTKAPVKSVYTKKGDCPTSPIKVKRDTPGEGTDSVHMQALWGWHYDNRDIHNQRGQSPGHGKYRGPLLHQQPT